MLKAIGVKIKMSNMLFSSISINKSSVQKPKERMCKFSRNYQNIWEQGLLGNAAAISKSLFINLELLPRSAITGKKKLEPTPMISIMLQCEINYLSINWIRKNPQTPFRNKQSKLGSRLSLCLTWTCKSSNVVGKITMDNNSHNNT